MTRLHSQIGWLGQHNAELVLKNIEANPQLTDLGARQQALEEELARVTGERDIQRAGAEQKAWEAEAQTAELQRLRTVLEQKETELLQKEVTIVTLTGTLQEKGKALEEKEVAIQNMEAAPGRRKTPCPRSRRPPESRGRRRRRASWVSTSKFRCSWILLFHS